MVSLVVCFNNKRKVKVARRLIKFTTSRGMLSKGLVVEEVHMETCLVTTSNIEKDSEMKI
jgi:hypothetical protein